MSIRQLRKNKRPCDHTQLWVLEKIHWFHSETQWLQPGMKIQLAFLKFQVEIWEGIKRTDGNILPKCVKCNLPLLWRELFYTERLKRYIDLRKKVLAWVILLNIKSVLPGELINVWYGERTKVFQQLSYSWDIPISCLEACPTKHTLGCIRFCHVFEVFEDLGSDKKEHLNTDVPSS